MWSNISSSISKNLKSLQQHCSGSSSSSCGGSDNRTTNIYEDQTNKGQCGSPLMRYKHAVCATSSGYIYIHGGRYGNLPLDDDVWRFDPHQNTWLQLATKGSLKPQNLQEHTLLEYNEQLYLFGGQVSASNNENSFWRLDLLTNEWHSLSVQSSKFGAYLGPTNRRAHSAVIYADAMYIFGGFEDFRGSSAQLWEYDLLNHRWELCNLSSSSACHPEARHSHSAIVYQNSMYIYGGLADLKPLSDLWCWSWREKRWFKERTRGKSPGQLHGHTAIQAFGSMFVFGGERNGRTTRSLWRLNLSNMTWQKIRPKGIKPSPTTWHGAIANPLSILDEANYIIEGDPELFDKNHLHHHHHPVDSVSEHTSLINRQYLANNNNHRREQRPVVENQRESQLVYSKSSNVIGGNTVAKICSNSETSSKQNGETKLNKRKTRLSFLRKSRPKSTYELKHLHASTSATNFTKITTFTNNRHSISAAPATKPLVTQTKNEQQVKPESEQRNLEILNNLDTDIKQMFDDALMPNDRSENDEEESRMEVTLDQTSRSQYETAVQNQESLNLKGINDNIRSQRTSYAYTTPPSEANTLRDDSSSMEYVRKQSLFEDELDREQSGRALLDSNESAASGYDRRNNRPKSEIVQSLIDRADARIKHLYTPYFNNSIVHNDNSQSEVARLKSTFERWSHDKNQRQQQATKNYDKTKRHTIHQTTTYYNLYFSEDKSSSSSDNNNNNNNNNNETTPRESNQVTGNNIMRDNLSSNTIKAYAGSGSTNGTLIGVHQFAGAEISTLQSDQRSQLSLEATTTTNSSDSRTLCNDLNNINHTSQHEQQQLSSETLISSLTHALTGKRELTAENSGGDNTSLSFSVIAEFEEDDMLQYSSPTDPIIDQRFNREAANNRYNQTSDVRETFRQDASSEIQDDINNRNEVDQTASHNGNQPHKSTSSGYNSISGFEHQTNIVKQTAEMNKDLIKPLNSLNQNGTAISTSDTQEDSSVRTESSLGCFTTTETSPEQSATRKKMKGRSVLYNGKIKQEINNHHTTSSTTADSLILTSDGFESSIVPITGDNNNNVTSIKQQCCQSMICQSQRKSPIKLRLFSKQKSKNRYWHLCMFVIGGKQGGCHGINEPITIWRLYI